jgi:hypothetical protein
LRSWQGIHSEKNTAQPVQDVPAVQTLQVVESFGGPEKGIDPMFSPRKIIEKFETILEQFREIHLPPGVGRVSEIETRALMSRFA